MKLFKRFHSARTGRYVSKAEAQANPDTTFSETAERAPLMPIPAVVERAVRKSIRINGVDNTLERLAD